MIDATGEPGNARAMVSALEMRGEIASASCAHDFGPGIRRRLGWGWPIRAARCRKCGSEFDFDPQEKDPW